MRRILYAALAALIATPAFSVTANYINFTYYQPSAWYQTCGGPFSYGDRWDGHCGEADVAGNPVEQPWPEESTSSFKAAGLWVDERVDRADLRIGYMDGRIIWEGDSGNHDWDIIPFGLDFVDLNYWFDGWVSGGELDFIISFDASGEISSWYMSGTKIDYGATSFAFYSEPRMLNGHQYFGDAYFEPQETFVYRDPGYWVSDAVPPPVPLPASGLLLLAGIAGMGFMRWRSAGAIRLEPTFAKGGLIGLRAGAFS